MIMCIIYFLK